MSSFNAGCIAIAFWNSIRGKTDGNNVNGTTVKESLENCVFDLIPPPDNIFVVILQCLIKKKKKKGFFLIIMTIIINNRA